MMAWTGGIKPFPVYRSFSSQIDLNVCFHFQLLLAFYFVSLSSFFFLRHLLNAWFLHNYHNPHWWKCYHQELLLLLAPIVRVCRRIPFHQQLCCFPLFLPPCSQCKTCHPYPAIQMSYKCRTWVQTFASIVRQYFLWQLSALLHHHHHRLLWTDIAEILQPLVSVHSFSNWFYFAYKTFF